MSLEGRSESSNRMKKVSKLVIAMLGKGFNPSKCKTVAKLATSRIKLLRNKREAIVRQMRRDIAMLLESGQDATARIRVEHVIREKNIMEANEIIELFCELVVARLAIITKQRECPADLKEGISSLIFAAPRCSDIPELLHLRDIIEKKYGKEFVLAATDLRPNSGVNCMLVEKLSVKAPNGETKLKVMKEIAKEYQVEWNTEESELELLKSPEELLGGPRTFVSASSMPVKPSLSERMDGDREAIDRRSSLDSKKQSYFEDTASAARAAAESAEKAVSAAKAAAYLAQLSTHQNETELGAVNSNDSVKFQKHIINQKLSDSYDIINQNQNEDIEYPRSNNEVLHRRHSYDVPRSHSDIKFDNSNGNSEEDEDNEIISFPPICRTHRPSDIHSPPMKGTSEDNMVPHRQNSGSRIHPKLPDYETLAARFEALKHRRSSG